MRAPRLLVCSRPSEWPTSWAATWKHVSFVTVCTCLFYGMYVLILRYARAYFMVCTCLFYGMHVLILRYERAYFTVCTCLFYGMYAIILRYVRAYVKACTDSNGGKVAGYKYQLFTGVLVSLHCSPIVKYLFHAIRWKLETLTVCLKIWLEILAHVLIGQGGFWHQKTKFYGTFCTEPHQLWGNFFHNFPRRHVK